jgi:hypothetical protein
MIFLVYSLTLGFIIPFISFIFPYIFNLIIDKDMFPVDIALNILIPIIVALIFFLYHRQNTQIACETTNNQKALINATYVFIVMITWMMLLDYFPSIISPFLQLTSMDSGIAVFISKFIMIYALVFILLTYTQFNSISETCKINIKQIKEVYKKMESALN